MPTLVKKRYYVLKTNGFTSVWGKPIKISDWLETFVYLDEREKTWIITELTSGCSITNADTQKRAVEKAKELLSHFGKDRVLKLIEDSVKNNGEAPRG